MKEFIMFCGEYLSGMELIAETLTHNVDNCLIISTDTIITTATEGTLYEDKEIINTVFTKFIIDKFQTYNVITYTNLNFSKFDRIRLLNILKETFVDMTFVCVYVQANKNNVYEFNRALNNILPDKNINLVFDGFEKPVKIEGWDRVYYTQMDFEKLTFKLVEIK